MRPRTIAVLCAATVAAVMALPVLAATPKLTGTVGPGFTIRMAPKPTKPGKYTLVVSDRSNEHNFHLKGPGVNVKTSVVKKGTKRARQYEHVRQSEKDSGRSEQRAEEIAARTVNKEKARSGQSRTKSKSSTSDKSSGQRGGQRSGNGAAGRTKQQLYNDAKKMNISGRSNMSKQQLLAAVNRKGG